RITANNSPASTVVDDHATVPLDHVRQDRFRHQERAFQVDVDLFIPLFFRAIERSVRIKDTCIVEQNVDAAESTQDFIDRELTVAAFPYIAGDEDGMPTVFSNLLCYGVAACFVTTGDGDFCPFFGEQARRGLADARRAAGNESNFVLQSHMFLRSTWPGRSRPGR